ncbi:glycosyltransferase [candidate division KSB1 bacterium]|nr:glycosyltransferase [candidate division KSB1 bacterium]
MKAVKNKSSKNILVLCYYFPPMGMGGTQRAAKFVKYLPGHGWNPIVITVKDVHYHAHDDSLLDDVKDVTIIRTESLDPLRLLARLRRKSVSDSNSNSANTGRKGLLNWLNETVGAWLLVPDSKILWAPFAFFAAWKQIRQRHIRTVFTTSPPHSVHLIAVLLKRLTGIHWVADFRDDWTGGESQPCPSRLHRALNRLMERVVLRTADCVVGMCEPLTRNLQAKANHPSGRFETIMNGYDPADFLPYIETPLHPEFTITHCGSISRVSHPEPFLKGLKQFLDEESDQHSEMRMQFIGTDMFGNLQRLVAEIGLETRVDPIRYLPHHQAVQELMASHLLLLTIFRQTDEEIITGKVFEYLASGKPILIIARGGYVAQFITRLNRGIVVDNDDIAGIANAIRDYYQLYQQNKMPFAKPIAVPEFDRDQQAAHLARICFELETTMG